MTCVSPGERHIGPDSVGRRGPAPLADKSENIIRVDDVRSGPYS